MMENIAKILEIFEQINKIPRCSKKEEEIARWLIQWAKAKQLPVKSDRAGNVCSTLPPSPGREEAQAS